MPEPICRLKRGDIVRVRLMGDQEWTAGSVALASDTDPSSVLVLLEGPVHCAHGGIFVNGLPLSIHYAARRVTSLLGDSYEIEVNV